MSEHIESTASSGNVFRDLGLPYAGVELRLAEARLAGLPKPIAVALAELVSVAIESVGERGPQLVATLDSAIAAVMLSPEAKTTIKDDIQALTARVREAGDVLVIGYQSADDLLYATAGSLATQLGLVATLKLRTELSAVRRLEAAEEADPRAFNSD